MLALLLLPAAASGVAGALDPDCTRVAAHPSAGVPAERPAPAEPSEDSPRGADGDAERATGDEPDPRERASDVLERED